MTDQEILQVAAGIDLDDRVRHLSLRNLKGLTSFEPLRACKNIERLLLRVDGQIPDLSPITDCLKLKTLSIREKTKVPGFEFLTQMPQLKKLEINQRLYEKLEGLSPAIEVLHVQSSTIDHLNYFEQFRNLKEIELGADTGIYTKIGDDTDFKPIQQVERLFLLSRSLTTVKPLCILENCKSLFIGANKKLAQLEGLGQLTQLEALVVNRTTVSDLSPVYGLPLRYLAAGATKVKSVDDLDLPYLIHLYLGKSNLKTFQPENTFLNLQVLSLAETKIKGLEGLVKTPNLKYLGLQQCLKINDFKPLLQLEKLEALDLSETEIDAQTLEQLLNLPALKKVVLYQSALSKDEKAMQSLTTLASQKNILLITQSRDRLDFQKPYYKLMDFYLHAYKGKENPWYDIYKTGYEI